MTARARVNPLGYGVELISSAPEVIDIARELWSGWEHRYGDLPLYITVEVNDGPEADAAPTYRATGVDMLLYSDPSNLASFSCEGKSGLLRVSHATLERRRWFKYHLLEPLVLTALDMVFFDPIHAACVARRDKGVILCGEAGAGKTTLSYACAKAGWKLISEDGVRLTSGGSPILVGGFWQFRLREESRPLFPELADLPLVETPNGKMAMLLDAEAAGFPTARETLAGPSVFLLRRPGAPELTTFPLDVGLAYVLQTSKQPDRAASEKRLRAMLDAGCHLLSYDRVEDAVAILETLA